MPTKTMTKTQKKQQAEALRVRVMHLFACVARGNAFSANEAFEIAEKLCQDMAVTNFQELLEAKGSYRPTMRVDIDPRMTVLADLYDFFQIQRNDPRRAYRGSL